MPRIDINETFDEQGNLLHSEQVTVPDTVAGRYLETHQVAVGGATLRIGPAVDAPAIAQLPMSTAVTDTGQRQGSAAYVHTDTGSGWLPVTALVAI